MIMNLRHATCLDIPPALLEDHPCIDRIDLIKGGVQLMRLGSDGLGEIDLNLVGRHSRAGGHSIDRVNQPPALLRNLHDQDAMQQNGLLYEQGVRFPGAGRTGWLSGKAARGHASRIWWA